SSSASPRLQCWATPSPCLAPAPSSDLASLRTLSVYSLSFLLRSLSLSLSLSLPVDAPLCSSASCIASRGFSTSFSPLLLGSLSLSLSFCLFPFLPSPLGFFGRGQ